VEGSKSSLDFYNITVTNETCNYEIMAPTGQQVEVVFDVMFDNQFQCTPMLKPTSGIFISYAENGYNTYYDVICGNKTSYVVRSVGRRLFVKLVMKDTPFVYRGSYYYGTVNIIIQNINLNCDNSTSKYI
jgi:hypothetical protein